MDKGQKAGLPVARTIKYREIPKEPKKRVPMSEDIKITALIIAGFLSLALIIGAGVLLAKWMDLQVVTNVYLPGSKC